MLKGITFKITPDIVGVLYAMPAHEKKRAVQIVRLSYSNMGDNPSLGCFAVRQGATKIWHTTLPSWYDLERGDLTRIATNTARVKNSHASRKGNAELLAALKQHIRDDPKRFDVLVNRAHKQWVRECLRFTLRVRKGVERWARNAAEEVRKTDRMYMNLLALQEQLDA